LKRFYTAVAISEEAVSGGSPHFLITLDGLTARTPVGERLILPTSALAEAMAGEWRGQGEDMDFDAMPLTRLAGTAIDRVAPQRETIISGLMAYAASDLLCYRVAEPQELVSRQDQHWQPLLDWAGKTLGAELTATTGITPLSQSASSLEALEQAVSAHDPMMLAALGSAAAAAGSLVLALALAHAFIDAPRAFELSTLHEAFQIENWGEDEEAAQRLSGLRGEITQAARFMDLCRKG
jgi:chaperone required for assembly of F1-ATPase